MTLEDHARAIEAAIKSAAEEGYELDNGAGTPLFAIELNKVVGGEFIVAPEFSVKIYAPYSYY
jgi:2-keto-3-deoxy-6-phosphogluconate aldolase